jgi:hypothetical protein
LNLSAKVDRDIAARCPNSSTVQSCAGSSCIDEIAALICLSDKANNHPTDALFRYSTFAGEVVGYQYQDWFAFVPPPDWINNLDLTYADDSGKNHTVSVKTAVFEQ